MLLSSPQFNADTAGVDRDLLRQLLRLSPDATEQDINAALFQLCAVRDGTSLDQVDPGGPRPLDGALLRDALRLAPDASAAEVNAAAERLNAPPELTTLAAATPKIEAATEDPDETSEKIRRLLGISPEVWNQPPPPAEDPDVAKIRKALGISREDWEKSKP